MVFNKSNCACSIWSEHPCHQEKGHSLVITCKLEHCVMPLPKFNVCCSANYGSKQPNLLFYLLLFSISWFSIECCKSLDMSCVFLEHHTSCISVFVSWFPKPTAAHIGLVNCWVGLNSLWYMVSISLLGKWQMFLSWRCDGKLVNLFHSFLKLQCCECDDQTMAQPKMLLTLSFHFTVSCLKSVVETHKCTWKPEGCINC